MANGPAQPGTAWARARHGPMGHGPLGTSCLLDRAFPAHGPCLRPRHGIVGYFLGRAGPKSTVSPAGRASPRPTRERSSQGRTPPPHSAPTRSSRQEGSRCHACRCRRGAVAVVAPTCSPRPGAVRSGGGSGVESGETERQGATETEKASSTRARL